MTAPTATDAETYLGTASGYDAGTIAAAFAAEKVAQAARCTVPADTDDWPADLTEALFRRTAHNLALRSLPLGVSAAITDGSVATDRVGGLDAEVRRLEAPYRRVVVG